MSSKIVNNRQPEEPRDRFEAEVRRALKRLIPREKRAEIAAALTSLMGRKITKSMLDNFTAEGKCQPRMPLSIAKALCHLIPDPLLRRYLNSEEDLTLIEIGEHMRASKNLITQIATPTVKGFRPARDK
jgi:hypothetical protein